MNVQNAHALQTPISLWQKALDQSASGILVYEAIRNAEDDIETFVVRLANRKAEQILGISREGILGRTTTELFPPTQPTTLWDDIAEVIDSGTPQQCEFFYHVSRTKQDMWFDLCIEPLGDGQSAVVSFTDITFLKNTTSALLGESILFKSLSSTVPGMCVVVVNYFHKVLFANGNLPGLFCSSIANDVVGKRVADTVLPEFREEWQHHVATALMGQKHNFSDQWGGWRCECYVGPVCNERGDVVMAMCVFRDISEQYRQQQILQRTNNDLIQSNHSLEQFAYVASHDLQEPLRKIKSFGDLLNERHTDALDQGGQDLIRRMQSAADRMDRLIKGLLAYARVTTPARVSSHHELISLNDLLIDVQNDLEIVIHEREALIRPSSNLPKVPGDPIQLRQLFQNLLSNGIKFTKPGKRPEVSITGDVIPGRDIPKFPGVDLSQSYALINIQDNGIGIAPENFDKIFGLFNRLHGRQQFAGSGIGLATCKRVAENHGGTITVDSQVNQGTTFHVYLPLVLADQTRITDNEKGCLGKN
jgi:PAS domain S-box-containing protein